MNTIYSDLDLNVETQQQIQNGLANMCFDDEKAVNAEERNGQLVVSCEETGEELFRI